MRVQGIITEVRPTEFVADVYEFPNAEPQPILFKTFGNNQQRITVQAKQYMGKEHEVGIDFNIFGNAKDGKHFNPSLRCWSLTLIA